MEKKKEKSKKKSSSKKEEKIAADKIYVAATKNEGVAYVSPAISTFPDPMRIGGIAQAATVEASLPKLFDSAKGVSAAHTFQDIAKIHNPNVICSKPSDYLGSGLRAAVINQMPSTTSVGFQAAEQMNNNYANVASLSESYRNPIMAATTVSQPLMDLVHKNENLVSVLGSNPSTMVNGTLALSSDAVKPNHLHIVPDSLGYASVIKTDDPADQIQKLEDEITDLREQRESQAKQISKIRTELVSLCKKVTENEGFREDDNRQMVSILNDLEEELSNLSDLIDENAALAEQRNLIAMMFKTLTIAKSLGVLG